MDGKFDQLVFVATQSDKLHQNEIVESLGDRFSLTQESDRQECAIARNEYTRERILEDFYQGIEDMQKLAPERMQPHEVRERYKLPVFCVSSFEYQQFIGVRKFDGEPKTFQSAEATEIPLLMKHIQ